MWYVSAAAAAAPVLLVEASMRVMVKRQRRRFDRELTRLLQARQLDELLPAFRRQTLLRFAAPRHYLLGKLGLIYTSLGEHRAAAAAYDEALSDAPGDKAFMLAVGQANSLYEIGEDAEAERTYLGAIDQEHVDARACANLARLILKRGGSKEKAESYMAAAVDVSRGGALRCELVQLLLTRDKREDAAWHLRLAAEELKAAEGEERALLEQTLAAAGAAGIDLSVPAGEAPAAEPGEPEAREASEDS